MEKSGKIHKAIFSQHVKRLHNCVCLFSSEINSNHGCGQFHLKPDIQRFVLSTEPFLRDICGLRYLKKKSDLLVNH